MLQVRVCMSQLNIEDFVLQLTWHSQIKKKKKELSLIESQLSGWFMLHTGATQRIGETS